MQTFYNKYGMADNNSPHTKFIDQKVTDMTKEILAYAEKHDLSLIEVEHWVNRILSAAFCETAMMNALKIRKTETCAKSSGPQFNVTPEQEESLKRTGGIKTS